jgi:hypothetical protein
MYLDRYISLESRSYRGMQPKTVDSIDSPHDAE